MKHSEGFLKLVDDAKSRIKEVTVADTRDRISTNRDSRLIDVREDDEWRAGHASGAEHLGKGIIERDIEATIPDKATEVILYCGGGYRSALAADVLQQMGYTNVICEDCGLVYLCPRPAEDAERLASDLLACCAARSWGARVVAGRDRWGAAGDRARPGGDSGGGVLPQRLGHPDQQRQRRGGDRGLNRDQTSTARTVENDRLLPP